MLNKNEFYINNIKKYNEIVSIQTKYKNRIATLRALIFVISIVLPFVIEDKGALFLCAEIALIVLFILSIRLFTKVKGKIGFFSELCQLNKNELTAIETDMYPGENGNEFNNPAHRYTFDLDIFGNNSIFQFINRTSTKVGKNQLAMFLSNLNCDKDLILKKQKAIEELSRKTAWRQEFQAKGNISSEERRENTGFSNSGLFPYIKKTNGINSISKNDSAKFKNWFEEDIHFASKQWLRISSKLLPLSTILCLLLYLLIDLQSNWFILLSLIQLGFTGFFLKKTNDAHSAISRQSDILNKYQLLLEQIEKLDVDAELIKELKNKLVSENLFASKKIKQLKLISKMLDNRLNMLFAIFGNALFLIDINMVIKLEDWKSKHYKEYPKWLDVIGKIDALNSFATFAYNHPNYCYAEITNDREELNIKKGGHILLNKEKRVDNDFNLKLNGQVAIITGANMAGKSTFLRTIGVNLILAHCGSPVCAQSFKFFPMPIFTSIRVNDSIQENESYFYAEIKRLKSIVNEVTGPQKPFVIVDEMLRGTNSKDKHTGSLKFIEKLIANACSGIIATHDLELSKLENRYPNNIVNQKFEVEIEENKLIFDYLLQKGVSQNLNATFLMKKHQIID